MCPSSPPTTTPTIHSTTQALSCRPMPPIRPTGPVSDWWLPNHASSKLSVEPPVTPGQPLWRLAKSRHIAAAYVRPIDGVGVELRYEWNGDLRVSQMFKSWEELEASATEKR